jgi:outer membrane protein assembly factor BamB
MTDGKRVYAFFGSRGLYCFDMNGNPLWEKDLGRKKIVMTFGEGATPVLYGDRIVVVWDHEGQSFIAAYDKTTGDEIWNFERSERTSWATPLVVEVNGRLQVIASATGRVRGYDLASGDVIWECGGMTRNVIPCPVSADGMVYVMSGFRGSALRAIRLADAQGDITETSAVVWARNSDTPYTPSPLLYDGFLYMFAGNDEFLTCLDAKSGAEHYVAQKVEGLKGVYSSPVGAAGRVYLVGRNGAAAVIERGPDYKVLATNTLDESFTASPAIVGNEIYLRGHKSLYCVSGK